MLHARATQSRAPSSGRPTESVLLGLGPENLFTKKTERGRLFQAEGTGLGKVTKREGGGQANAGRIHGCSVVLQTSRISLKQARWDHLAS